MNIINSSLQPFVWIWKVWSPAPLLVTSICTQQAPPKSWPSATFFDLVSEELLSICSKGMCGKKWDNYNYSQEVSDLLTTESLNCKINCQSLDDSQNWHLIGFASSASSVFKLHSSLLIFWLLHGSFMELPNLIQVPWSSIYLGCTLLSSTHIPSLQYISLKSPVKGLLCYPALW